jgi:Bacteriophage probable baseplate hub protein
MASIKAARPTILVAGEEQGALAERLLSLVVQETTSGLFGCEAVFGNWGTVGGQIGFLYFDRKLLDFGKPFAIALGRDALFEGRITGLEANFPAEQPPELAVLAEDRLQDLRMTRRTRTFLNVTDADVMQTVAGDHGLNPNVTVSGPPHRVLAQVNQSDLAFLRDRARAIDAELWMSGRTLNVMPRSKRSGSPLRLAFGRELRSFSALSDLAGQRSSVAVSGWDVASKSALTHEADESALGGELGSDASGVSILKSALGNRKEAVVHSVPLDGRETQARAEAYFKSMARRFVTGRGVAEPDARLRVGASADLVGLGPMFSGKYYVAEVRHVFDGAGGLRTEFTAERPGIGRA